MLLTAKRTEETNWNQVKEMVAAGAMKVGDEIQDVLLNGEKITYVVADIDHCTAKFISKNCLGERKQWNESGYNTGGFKESSLCQYLNTEVWNMLPEELRAVISERECLQIVEGEETKYNLNLWLPTEYEVFEDDWASEAKEGKQFELFKDPRNRIKCLGEEGGRASWWLLSVCGGFSPFACSVATGGGSAGGSDCTSSLGVPVCFQI